MTTSRCPMLLVLLAAAAQAGAANPPPGLLESEFIFTRPPHPACHASTITDTPDGLVAAWFGGTAEKNPDVGIWVARHDGFRWSQPDEVATGIETDGRRYPTWNPVLFQPAGGPLQLYYKVGPNPAQWWGMLLTSTNGGRSWMGPRRLPKDILGPIKNKPVTGPDGALWCPSSTEHDGWRIHMEFTRDSGVNWTRTPALNTGPEFSLIQPAVLAWPDGRVQLLCRSRQKSVVETWSTNNGTSWSPPAATVLPNPNSGLDAVRLSDGRALLVYNHVERGRSPLNLAVSPDGTNWFPSLVLEDAPGEYSYPAIIQARDGKVHVTYTWKRTRIRHDVIDPARLVVGQQRFTGQRTATETRQP